MSLNDRLLHHAIGHHIRVQRYSAGQGESFQPILDEAHAQIDQLINQSDDVLAEQNSNSGEFAALIAAILAILDDAKANLQAKMEESLREFVNNEAQNEIDTLSSESGLTLVVPALGELQRTINDVAFQGRYLDTWIEDLVRGDFSRIQATVIGGMQRGDHSAAVVAALALAYGTAANMLSNLVRTVYNGVTNWVRLLIFGANSDVILRVQWHATLDEVTCPICMELDGQVFRVDQIDPPPAHPSCRCFLVAIFGSANQVLASKRHAAKFKKLSKAKREAFDGKNPVKVRYAVWLKAQPLTVQNEALGVTRAKLFRKGKLSINRFTNHKGHIFTLAELKKRDAAAFRRAGLSKQ